MTAMGKIAVLTGGHPYDVPAFYVCLKSLPGLDCQVQSVQEMLSSCMAKVSFTR